MTASQSIKARRPAMMAQPEHSRLWRLVEGGVVDAFTMHPDYLTPAGNASAVRSITKRVVGQLVGHAKQARQRGRLGDSREGSASFRNPQGLGRCLPPPQTRFPDLHLILCGGA